MKQIIFASANQDKLREVRRILGDLGLSVISMKEAGFTGNIDESGTTFQENALIKARTVQALTGGLVLADDSGLSIDFFDGGPGVYSARFLGHETSYVEKNAIILARMAQVPEWERGARYVCAIAAVLPDGREVVETRTMEGSIAYESAGERGFGYDPIFRVQGMDLTAAQLTDDEKNAISHRGKALRAMRETLKNILNEKPGGEV